MIPLLFQIGGGVFFAGLAYFFLTLTVIPVYGVLNLAFNSTEDSRGEIGSKIFVVVVCLGADILLYGVFHVTDFVGYVANYVGTGLWFRLAFIIAVITIMIMFLRRMYHNFRYENR